MNLRTKAHIYLFSSILTGSLMPIMLFLAKGMNIFEFFALTYLLTIPISFILMHANRKQDELKAYLKDKRRLLQLIAIGILIYVPIGFSVLYAEHYVSASLATVIFRTYPLLMLIFISYILKEKLSRSQFVAILLGFLGLYFALANGNLLGIFQNPNLLVMCFLSLSTLVYSFGVVLSKKYMFNVESGIFIFSVSLFLIFATLFLITGMNFSTLTPAEILSIVYVSVANNVAGFYMSLSSLRVLKTTFVTNLNLISPFITFIFAAFILGEAIQPYYLLIALMVAVGLLIQSTDKVGGTYLQGRHKNAITIFDVTGAFVESKEIQIKKALSAGGKVLAIKLDSRHRTNVNQMAGLIADRNVHLYTELHKAIKNEEAAFVNEIIGTTRQEMVLLCAGDISQSEYVLNEIASKISEG